MSRFKSVALWLAFLALTLVCGSCSKPSEPGAAVRARLPFGALDTPTAGATLRGQVLVGGWALSEDGVEKVAIYVDRNFVTEATLGGPRPDVAKIFPGHPDSNAAGWSATLDTGQVTEGPHELTVQARSKAGATRDLGTINIVVAH